MNLRYKIDMAQDMGITDPYKDMERLGIGYKGFTPQTLGDQIWFIDCENVPTESPEYITKLEMRE